MAGVPFDVLDRLSTQATAAAAREVLVKREAVAQEKLEPTSSLRSAEAGQDLAVADTTFEDAFERELNAARSALLEFSRRVLPPYLVFAGGGTHDLLTKLLGRGGEEWTLEPTRNARARDRERRLLLYLQRVCAKNDTFGAFGPSAWGTIRDGEPLPLSFPANGIIRRDTFFERWTAHAIASALNADPQIRAELSPRLHPNSRVEGNQLVFTDTCETMLLGSDTVALLNRCDGRTPAHSLAVPQELLEHLAQQNILRWEMEVPALEPHAFSVLLSEIQRWRDNQGRARWLEPLKDLANLPEEFARAEDTSARVNIMESARQRVQDIGGPRDSGERFLYAAGNPIAEECARSNALEIPQAMADELARGAAPWIDLWRDTYAFVASRVAAGLRHFFQTAPVHNGAVPLAGFLKHCATQKMPLTGHGIVALAHIAFQEVKAGFREEIKQRAECAELELGEYDCHFVRRNFAYEKFDEYTYPSADLQISARSAAEAAAGDYQWIVSELHPPVALLHHCFYWSCPDRAELARALASTTFGQPAFHYGFVAADFTAHTAVRWLDALPESTYFVAPQRGKSHWNIVRPAEAEVYIDEQTGDVCARKLGSGEYLGSFARSWIIPLGFHPFHFGGLPHIPRLRCGRVIVQRRSWIVRQEEFPEGNYKGASRDLILAVERLRREKNWPRHIYIRPSEQALRRSGAEGRDKDTKPVYIDLESYLFLEIFYRWLMKAGELEVTEMLPDPDHLLWREAEGRRTFELRTQIVPG